MSSAPVFGTAGRIANLLEPSIASEFRHIDQSGMIVAEYVWIDASGVTTRSKCRVLPDKKYEAKDLPTWNFDGSSTGQAPGHDSEVFIKPQAVYRDPFRGGNNILVMCDCWVPPQVDQTGKVTAEMKPHKTNTRHRANEIMSKIGDQDPWFGIEQEYTLLAPDSLWPLGWPKNGYPGAQGPYYCSAGSGAAIGRDVADVHLKMCMFAGIKISGVNAEVMPGQWEYQVGPCHGMEMGDMLVMSRYILARVCEMYNVILTLDPKPVPGDWNGAGGHVNYSNKDTRTAGTGFDAIVAQCEKLGKRHAVHVAAYGEGNERRLTGAHETSSINDFSWGVANRGCSIRIGRMAAYDKCGYYEDRRPASNLDPYLVTGLIVETTLLL